MRAFAIAGVTHVRSVILHVQRHLHVCMHIQLQIFNQRANYKDKSCVTMYATTYPHLSTNEKIMKRYVPCTRFVRTAFCTCSFLMHHADARKPPSALKYLCSMQASYMTFSHKFCSWDCICSQINHFLATRQLQHSALILSDPYCSRPQDMNTGPPSSNEVIEQGKGMQNQSAAALERCVIVMCDKIGVDLIYILAHHTCKLTPTNVNYICICFTEQKTRVRRLAWWRN